MRVRSSPAALVPALLGLALLALLTLPGAALVRADDPPTFARDVAPIVWRSCAVCHRAGGSAPFALTSYEEVARHARTIATVTAARIMPPWLPERGDHALQDERLLDAEQIDTLRRWAEAGAPAGDPAELPPLPSWPSGWQLGEPDLVVEFPAQGPFELAAEGPDSFRNFVVRAPLERARWVRAFELQPGDTRAIHHARLHVDKTESCARLEQADPLPGFSGMGMGESAPPDGHLVGWTPGKAPRPVPEGTAWELAPETDLVLQLHLTPTGKPELVRPRIGLHFTDEPPRRALHSALLFSEDIFLPAGAKDVRIEDELVLPVDVQLLAVYPHAHYLGKSFLAEALHPGGRAEELLRIDDWNFDWQDEYSFREPVRLEAGVRLHMTWTFDNSEANPRNPSHPPRPVRYGLESADEMATVSFSMLPATEQGLHELRASAARHTLAKRPTDTQVAAALGVALIEMGKLDEAQRVLARSLELQPGSAVTWTNLGLAFAREGQDEQALEALQRALEIDGRYGPANLHLGRTLMKLGH
jgi:hypothetical protein